MKILVCGDRHWKDFLTIYTVLKEYEHTAEAVIHGAATGADTLAGDAAEALHIPVRSYPAEWDKGPAAGPIRNRRMLQIEHPDMILAFHNDLENSKGTKDMVGRAKQAGIPVHHYTTDGGPFIL
jgi:hypothetical protein